MPGLRWAIANGTDPRGIAFDVDAAGNVDAFNSVQASGTGDTLTFETVQVQVDPTSYTGTYRVASNIILSGISVFDLVPDLNYVLYDGGTAIDTFRVLAGSVTPTQS
jgi:hypothetical protein